MVKTISIASLSSGILGERSVKHEVDIGMRRLRDHGITVKFTPNALKGSDYIREHPEKRAEDLLGALRDTVTDMILCAIGGDDTYRLLPYLFENGELRDAVSEAPDKLFLGFSDTTVNHFMLHKAGMRSFYGQSFLSDVCELGPEMLPYTRRYFEELIHTGCIREVAPSSVWYGERESFGPEQVGIGLTPQKDRGFELLRGKPVFSGEILGGCIDSMYDMFDGGRYADMPELCERYGLFPGEEEWRGRIILLESSEEKMPPEKYRRALECFKDAGVFDAVSGVLVGKPMDGAYEQEYKTAILDTIDDADLPVLCNINIGHALPRCIIPFGVMAHVDAEKQLIGFAEDA